MNRLLPSGAGSTARIWLSAIILCSLAGCTKKEVDTGPSAEELGKECMGDTCASASPPVDWKSDDPTFFAHVLVVDANGNPVEGAKVVANKRHSATDKSGFGRVGPVPADKPEAITVTKDGSTPRPSQTSAFKSGKEPAHVVLTPVGTEEEIAPKERVVVSHDGARVDLPPKSLVQPDGTHPEKGKAEMTQLSPERAPQNAFPSSSEAYDRAGAPTAMGDLLSVTYLHFTNDAGDTLNLAPGQTALLEVPLPKNSNFKMGQSVPMWTLDEKDNTWHEEKSCVVESRKNGKVTESVCRGIVSHFSFWAIAEELDIYQPNALGCVNAVVSAEENACFSVAVESETLLACDKDGASCRVVSPYREAFERGNPVLYCSVVPPSAGTYRVELTYSVDVSGCTGANVPLSGRRVLRGKPFKLDSFQTMLGSDLMLNFTLAGERDCATLCAQAELTVTTEALNAPGYIDHDGDGAWVATDPSATPPLGARIDCNDNDPTIHPLAPEPFCATEDRNCDGKVPGVVKNIQDLPSWKWNSECKQCLAQEGSDLKAGDEEVGNEYDEDCNGRVDDRDLDGVSVPEDCNDWDTGMAPGLKEVPGNYADENCDDVVVDADDDGMPDRRHAYRAGSIAADFPQFTPDTFIDCDDYDPATNPKASAANEAGQVLIFYYRRGEQLRRRVSYCSLFYQDGSPTNLFYEKVKDLNCDGQISDADGDSFTRADDSTLGSALALDCDDLDPRVGAGTPVKGAPLMCESDPAALVNDSICQVSFQPYNPGVSCPVLTLSGTSLVTTCEEAKNVDGSGTGLGVCSFAGWWDTNPLSIHPGELYGPCDGQSGDAKLKLPPCKSGTVCGGLAGAKPWTPEFDRYIRNTYAGGDELSFQGMCFPGCIVE